MAGMVMVTIVVVVDGDGKAIGGGDGGSDRVAVVTLETAEMLSLLSSWVR